MLMLMLNEQNGILEAKEREVARMMATPEARMYGREVLMM